jgi:chromosome segregation ATPase
MNVLGILVVVFITTTVIAGGGWMREKIITQRLFGFINGCRERVRRAHERARVQSALHGAEMRSMASSLEEQGDENKAMRIQLSDSQEQLIFAIAVIGFGLAELQRERDRTESRQAALNSALDGQARYRQQAERFEERFDAADEAYRQEKEAHRSEREQHATLKTKFATLTTEFNDKLDKIADLTEASEVQKTQVEFYKPECQRLREVILKYGTRFEQMKSDKEKARWAERTATEALRIVETSQSWHPGHALPGT